MVLALSSSSAKNEESEELDEDTELPQDDAPLSLKIATLAALQAEEEAAKKKLAAAFLKDKDKARLPSIIDAIRKKAK